VHLLSGVLEDISRFLEGLCQRHIVRAASGCLYCWPLAVTTESPSIARLTVVQVSCGTLGLRNHLAGPLVSLGFDAWASPPQQGMGREISQR
jgi:hypothetical protein